MTEKLYLNDPFLLEFEAHISELASWQDRPAIVLDRSAFYGEAGGQLGDRGSLRMGEHQVSVNDCQYDEAGRLLHVLDDASPQFVVGSSIVGQVAFPHRRDMMSQHTGQHLLSAVCWQRLQAETVSSRLGSSLSTLDLDIVEISDAQIYEVANEANRIIMEDRPVRALYPDDTQLQSMPLRRLPKVTRNIRILEIEGYDLTPCGGTHCTATGQIGPLQIIGRERYKGKVRLNFLCGDRVLQRLVMQEQRLQTMGQDLGCGAAGVEEAVTKLQREVRESKNALGQMRRKLIGFEVSALHEAHPPQSTRTFIIHEYEDADIDAVRALAAGLTTRADVVALVAARDDKGGDWRVVLDAGSDSGFDAGAWFKSEGKAAGGRGGGRSQHAEGRFPASFDPHALSFS